MIGENGLFIKLYLDEDVQTSIAVGLRARGFDAIAVKEVGRRGFSDAEQLAYAAEQGRVIFTYNVIDYQDLHAERLRAGEEHAGIIVSSHISVGEGIVRLLNLLNETTADEMRTQLLWL